jgi:hypothetical protein
MRTFTDVSRFQGSLAVVLDNGLELTIPNELLVVPQKLIDDSGEVRTNTTYSEILIQPTLGNDAADIPVVGKQFFSSTYLFVNHDVGTFTVWQANDTQETRLISVGGDCNVTESEESPVAGSPSGTSSAAIDPSQSASERENGSNDLSTGTIAGIAVGAAGSLVAIAIIIYMCFVRRKKRKVRNEKSLLIDDAGRYGHQSSPYREFETRHELHNVATSELNAAEYPRELPSGKEASELGCVESKRVYKTRSSPHSVYELASSSPRLP